MCSVLQQIQHDSSWLTRVLYPQLVSGSVFIELIMLFGSKEQLSHSQTYSCGLILTPDVQTVHTAHWTLSDQQPACFSCLNALIELNLWMFDLFVSPTDPVPGRLFFFNCSSKQIDVASPTLMFHSQKAHKATEELIIEAWCAQVEDIKSVGYCPFFFVLQINSTATVILWQNCFSQKIMNLVKAQDKGLNVVCCCYCQQIQWKDQKSFVCPLHDAFTPPVRPSSSASRSLIQHRPKGLIIPSPAK